MALALSEQIESLLSVYVPSRQNGAGGPFGKSHEVWTRFDELAQALRGLESVQKRPKIEVKWSAGQGNWARVPWVALVNLEETTSIQHGVYVVFLFREDMTGVYLTLNQGVTTLKQRHGTRGARELLKHRANLLTTLFPEQLRSFETGGGIDLRTEASLGRAYEHSTVAYKLYERGAFPSDAEIEADLDVVLTAYDSYMESDLRREFRDGERHKSPPSEIERVQDPSNVPSRVAGSFAFGEAAEGIVAEITSRGFVYEPWQIAQYIAAVRTKPFVILAGITGTGKSKLPRLVADASGGTSELVPVRPDWTDSSEVLGYTDLEGVFRPGVLLEVASTAMGEDDVHRTLIVDEMNLARVEYYFAEVLSRIEDRHPAEGGGFESSPLLRTELRGEDEEWGRVRLPPNLVLAGTVNMDESAHGFSRKVLDRAFTIELSEIDLEAGLDHEFGGGGRNGTPWPVSAWFPRATRLSELRSRNSRDDEHIVHAVNALVQLNEILTHAQLQIGYRTRDEVALFLIHAAEIEGTFRTSSGDPVSPLDLALQMKILPRIAGGSAAIRRLLLGLVGWAWMGQPFVDESEVKDLLEQWESNGRSARLQGARYPGLASRSLLMFDRLQMEGFTSYWL